MPKKKIKKRETKKQEINPENNDNKILFAFLATFLSIVGFVIALIAKRDDKYVMFYAKQSLVIFIIGIIAGIIEKALSWIPVTGPIINFALGLIVLILWLLSWVYALSGKTKNIPVVEYWAKKIRL